MRIKVSIQHEETVQTPQNNCHSNTIINEQNKIEQNHIN